jgi:hypothetical protein
LQFSPKIDFVGAADIEKSNSMYSEESEAFCSQSSASSSGSSQSQSSDFEPEPRYRTETVEFDESVTEEMKLALVHFGETIGVNRLLPTMPFNRYQVDTQRKKGDACRRMQYTTYKIVAPGYEDLLQDLDLKAESDSVWSTKSLGKLKSVLEIIANTYEETENWFDRRQLIVLVVPVVSFAELSTYIKGLTHFCYTAAWKFAFGI